MSTAKLTKRQLQALLWLASGKSLRGYCHGITINHLKIKGMIEDSDTITKAGRRVISEKAE